MHADIRTKYGADWPETNPENAPDRQPKLPLLGATHPELISVLFHMYFFFFHMYFASNKHFYLFHNVGFLAEFFLQ